MTLGLECQEHLSSVRIRWIKQFLFFISFVGYVLYVLSKWCALLLLKRNEHHLTNRFVVICNAENVHSHKIHYPLCFVHTILLYSKWVFRLSRIEELIVDAICRRNHYQWMLAKIYLSRWWHAVHMIALIITDIFILYSSSSSIKEKVERRQKKQ